MHFEVDQIGSIV